MAVTSIADSSCLFRYPVVFSIGKVSSTAVGGYFHSFRCLSAFFARSQHPGQTHNRKE